MSWIANHHNVFILYCTVPSEQVALALADSMVEKKLAACVNIVPTIQSVYSWKNEICHDRELLMIVKTTENKLALLAQLIETLHPYEVPELIAVPVTAGLHPYLQWVSNCIS